ncbi:MAG: hypothetical protein JSR80_08025 [Verrucomicrobia bacterium]|nr:hypothetical protein [Verrucomicrobiota bacterium]
MMGECSQEGCCPEKKECHEKEEYECDFSSWLLEVADEAWTEVLKEKIKEYILSTQEDRMTELAKIVAEANDHRWKHRMEKNHCCMDFKEKLSRFFGGCKK